MLAFAFRNNTDDVLPASVDKQFPALPVNSDIQDRWVLFVTEIFFCRMHCCCCCVHTCIFLVVNFPWFEPLRTLMPGLEFSSNEDWKSGRQKQVKRLRILWNTQISDLRKAAVKSVPD